MVVAPLSETFVFLFHCRAPRSCSSHWSPLGGAVCLRDRVDKVPLGTTAAPFTELLGVERCRFLWSNFLLEVLLGSSLSCEKVLLSDLVLKVRLVGGGRGGTRGPHRRRFCRRVMELRWRNLLVLEECRGGFQRRWLRSSDLLLGCSGFGGQGVQNYFNAEQVQVCSGGR